MNVKFFCLTESRGTGRIDIILFYLSEINVIAIFYETPKYVNNK